MTAEVQVALAGLLFALAQRWGAAPEKLLAGGLCASLLLPWAYSQIYGGDPASLNEPGAGLWLEVFWFTGFCTIAVHANRLYPLWVGGAQIVALSSHWVHAMEVVGLHPACHLIHQFADAVAFIALATGLVCHVMRERRLGRSYPSWSGGRSDTFTHISLAGNSA